NQAFEACRAGNIGTLTNIDEERALINVERFEPGQATRLGPIGNTPGRSILYSSANRRNVLGRTATAAADDIDQAAVRELGNNRRHLFGRLIVFPKFIGQAGIGMSGNKSVGLGCQLFKIRAQLCSPQGTVEPDRQRLRMAYRVPEGLGGLTRKRT